MNSDWRIIPLCEIVSFRTGRLDSNAAEEGGIFPFFTCSPSTLAINKYAFDDEAVLLAGNNANGVFPVKYFKGKFNAYQRTYVITPIDKKRVSVRWLYFRIKHVTDELQQMSIGTATKFLTKKILDAYEVELPPFEKQVRIASILWSLQDKIELNHQTNQTLEQIAQAMFKSWFVDFEPVRAKIAANIAGENVQRAAMAAISGKNQAALDQLEQQHPEQYQQLQATADLFPDDLIDSELGEIPEGWKVKTLSKTIKIIGGGTPKRSETSYWGGTIPWFSVRDVPAESDIFVIDTTEKITETGMQKSSTKLLPKGTTIITARGTVGKLALVATPMCMNQSCYGIEAAKGIGPYFNFFNLREAIGTLLQNTHGAVFDTITTQTFESYSMAVASRELIQAFDELVEPLLKKVEQNIHETTGISELRDTLLPKLLSGELSDYARIEVHS